MHKSPSTSEITFSLASGQQLTAAVKRSSRARRISLSLAPDGSLSLTMPTNIPLSVAESCRDELLPWLERAWARHLEHLPIPGLPERILLPLSRQEYRIEQFADFSQGRRHSTQAEHAMLCTSGAKRVLLLEKSGYLQLYGAQDDNLASLALRRWCHERATALLPDYVHGLARTGGFVLDAVQIRDQRSRWGCCSRHTDGRSKSVTVRINLDWRAILLPVHLLEHLAWHELCHQRHMNHSAAYHDELTKFSPHWTELEKALNHFGRTLPVWTIGGLKE